MASLTTSDLQHEDLQNKQWHSQEYGYDYAANAGIQDMIHLMVSAEVEFDMTNLERSLELSPGTHSYNGSSFTVTPSDRDAYCARFPQVCSTGSKREEILELLKGGGTTAPAATEVEPEEEESQPEEPPVTPEESQEEISSAETPVLPLPPVTSTHRIKTRGGRLALRDAPATSTVSEVASEDTDKKGALIEMLDNGTTFVVLDPGTGHQCEWHHVRYGNADGYLYNKFTEEIPSSGHTFLEYDCESPRDSAFNLPADWTTKEPNTPYQDTISGKWVVAYETEYESTGGAALQERMLSSRLEATRLILSENGKNTSDEYVGGIVDAVAAVRAEDYYISQRPNENMRILVTIPTKYMSKLEDQAPVIDGDDDGDGEIFAGSVQTQVSNYRSGTTKHVVFYLDQENSYRDRIDRVATGMREYASQIDGYNGEVRGLDFRQEADRMKMFVQRLNNLLTANRAPTHGFHSVEIGMNTDFELVYAAENHRGFYQQLTSGWDSFVDSEPVDSPRTMRYMFFLWDMEDAVSEEMDWIEFVGRFTDYEPVEIIPSSESSQSPSDITGAGNENNPSSSGQTLADKVDKKISPEEEIPDSCYENVSIKGLAQGALRRPKTLKGAGEKLTEDLILSGLELRKGVRDEALITADFVGEPLLSDVFNQVGKIEDLDDVFDVVLNKISLMDLVGAILACFNLELKVDLDIPLPLRLECLKLPKVPTIDLPDNLPTADIMADLSKEIFDGIIQALTEAFVTMIKDLVLSMMELCKEESEDEVADINGAIGEKNRQEAMNADEANKKGNQDKLAVLAAAGLLSGKFNKPITPEEKADRLADLAGLLGDVSLLIPPSELCRLLKGGSSPRTLSTIRSLIKRKYPHFASVLKTKTKIKDFMVLIGKLVDSRFCDTLAKAPRTKYGIDTTCKVIDTFNEPAAQNMRNKGDGITEDQILEQLDRALDRKKKRAEALKDLVGNLVDLQTGRANPFQDSMPPLFCAEDGSPGIISLKHDSLGFMMDKVLDTVFEPIYMSFNRDIKSYQPAMISGTNEKKEIPAAFKPEESKEYIWHPEVKRQEAMGVTFDFNQDFGKAEKKHANSFIEVEEGVRRVNTTTRDLLENLESTDAFLTKYDGEGIYYELVLPPDPNTRQALEQITEKFGGDATFADLDLGKLMTVLPDWKVRYKIPWQFSDKDYGQRVDDEYIIEIFPGETASSDLGLRREVEGTVEGEARDYIETLFAEQGMTNVFEANPDATPLPLDAEYKSTVSPSSDPTKLSVEVFVKGGDPCGDGAMRVSKGNAPVSWYDENITPLKAYEFASALEGEDRCIYIQMYMGQQHVEVWEVLKELYEPCWSAERVEDFNVYKLPPQPAVFGMHCERVWRNKFAAESDLTEAHEEYLASIRKYYSNYVHPQVTNDIVSLIAKQIANSMLFRSEVVDLPTKASDSKMTAHTPYLEKIVFTREPTKLEKACGIDPHLLSVREFKQAAKDDFENGGGFCSLVNGIDDDAKQDPMRESMLKSVVQMTIRCYIIDYFLRGIFAFAEFSIEETLDDYVLEFLIKKMMEEMNAYDNYYTEAFSDYLSSKVTLPAEPADAADSSSAPLHTEGEEESEEQWDSSPDENVVSILKEFFIHEFAVVVVEMREILGKDDALKHINFENSTNLHDKIIQEWLPVVDLSRGSDDVRFATVPESFADVFGDNQSSIQAADFDIDGADLSDSEKKIAATYLSELATMDDGTTMHSHLATNKTSFADNGLAFDLSNGNLFLETFFRLERRAMDIDYLAGLVVEEYGADIPEALVGQRLDIAKSVFTGSWDEVFPHDVAYVACAEIDSKVDKFIAKVVTGLEDSTYESIQGMGGNSAPTTVQKNYFSGVDLFDEDSEVAKSVWKVENFFADGGIATGLRLCYIPPVGSEFEGVVVNNDGLAAPEGAVLTTVNNIADKFKAFNVVETYDRDILNINVNEGVRSYSRQGTEDEHSRSLYTTPIIEVLSDAIYDDIKGSSLLSISGSSINNEVDMWKDKYDAAEVASLKASLVETPEYKALFKYSVPTERWLGLLTVYTIMSVSASPNVETIFDGTKDELYRAFMALSNPSYKASTGPSNSELARMQEHFTGISTPCFSFSFGGSGMPKGFGIDLIMKLAIKTPLNIFKALVEMIDPNIKIAKWIIDLARMVGVCLPMPLISLGLLPPTVFGFPPFGIGIGPPLTPLGFGYLALGFEIPIGNPFQDDDDESASSSELSAATQELCRDKEAEKQKAIAELKEKILSSR